MSLGLSQLACVLTSRYRKARPGEHLPPTGRAAGPRQSRGVFNPTPLSGNQGGFDAKPDIADCFLRLADLPTSALDRLSRYEHMLWRQARQIVFTLELLRRCKRAPIRSTFPFSFRRREPGALSEEFR